MNYKLDDISVHLTDSISEIFEDMFFTEVERCFNIDKIEPEEESFIVTIETLSPFKGKVGLIIDKLFSDEITMEIEGNEEAEVSAEMVYDTLNEIANTVTGRFLSRIVPENMEFSLGFAQTEKWNKENKFATLKENTQLFALEMDGTTVYCVLNKN